MMWNNQEGISMQAPTVFWKNPVLWFFFVFAILGLCVVSHYGLGWDDEWSRSDTGYINFNYIFHGAREALLNGNEKYHGPFLELLLVLIEKATGVNDMHQIYLLRHLVLFLLFFISLIAFYKSARYYFSPNWSLLACLMLVCTPRIFAESFYNSKDIGLLSFFNFSVYTLLRSLHRPSVTNIIWHALFSGMLLAIRIIGVVVPLVTVAYVGVLFLLNRRNKQLLGFVLLYLVLTIATMILCWPVLWEGPLHHFVQAWLEMKRYHWDGSVLYLGQYVPATELPWHYVLLWIGITTPPVFLLFFIMSIVVFLVQLIRTPFTTSVQHVVPNISLMLFIIPVCSVVLMHAVIYDGWRHLYFIYPLLILTALHGLYQLKNQWHKAGLGLLGIQLLLTGFWMVQNHPFEMVYFNSVSRSLVPNFNQRFEKDYWGLSYKQALQYLLQKHPGDTLNVAFENLPGELNSQALCTEDRARIQVEKKEQLKKGFFLTNYRWSSEPQDSCVKRFEVDEMSIMGIYYFEH